MYSFIDARDGNGTRGATNFESEYFRYNLLLLRAQSLVLFWWSLRRCGSFSTSFVTLGTLSSCSPMGEEPHEDNRGRLALTAAVRVCGK